MATAGVGGLGGKGDGPNPNVIELLPKLNLTEEEEAVVDFSDEKEEEVPALAEWALVGKVLSPSPVHVNTVRSAMKPAWGNPVGLKFRSIGEKGDNLFVVEFGSGGDLERVLSGSPWMVGKYAVLLQEYDEKLSASDIVFDRMELWVRILNLPLGWMNRTRGSRAMGLIGQVVKMDVDADGKASGAFLRARVAVEIDKPIRQGVTQSHDPLAQSIQHRRIAPPGITCLPPATPSHDPIAKSRTKHCKRRALTLVLRGEIRLWRRRRERTSRRLRHEGFATAASPRADVAALRHEGFATAAAASQLPRAEAVQVGARAFRSDGAKHGAAPSLSRPSTLVSGSATVSTQAHGGISGLPFTYTQRQDWQQDIVIQFEQLLCYDLDHKEDLVAYLVPDASPRKTGGHSSV